MNHLSHRIVRTIVIPLCGSILVASVAPRAASATDWTQLGFDSGHSGYNPNEETIGVGNVGRLRQAWSFSAGAGNDVGNVIEAGGIVYAPSANGTLYAISAASGTLLWSYPTGTGYPTSGSVPLYDQGNVYTVCNTSAATQGLCALNATTGAPVWTYTYPGSTSYIGAPPAQSRVCFHYACRFHEVLFDTLYFEACASSCSYIETDTNGLVRWSVAEPQGACEGNGGIPPAVATNGQLYVNFTCTGAQGSMDGLVAKNGNQHWSLAPVGQNAGLSTANGLIAAVLDSASPQEQMLFGIKGIGGKVKWQAQGGGWPGNGATMPTISPEGIILLNPSSGALAAWKITGKQRWSTSNTSNHSWPSVADYVVYTACAATPCAYNAMSGALLWGGPSGSPSYGVPIIANGVVYGACNGSNVCAWVPPDPRRLRLHVYRGSSR